MTRRRVRRLAVFRLDRLERLERRRPRRIVRAVYCGVNSFVSLVILAVVAEYSHAPFLFPSLGPTAFLLFHAPLAASASPHNTLLGHLIGVLAGWFALAVTGLLAVRPDLEDVDARRALACGLALGLTCGLMPLLDAAHPPAGTTTLIVALGLLRTPDHLVVLMAAVVLITAQGFVINRLAGLPYPLWRLPSAAAEP
ncbi:HPP family protein [Streptosporangium sandarakinum]|uniref:HPP family protein n=1 Tax=Streptosporangium sandarakinum TaxID=1260955 RepID=UPI003711707C